MSNDLQIFFILGIPRSGTTLLEQILDSHSEIAVCFEISSGRTLWRLNTGQIIKNQWKSLLMLNYFYNRVSFLLDPFAHCIARQATRNINYPVKTSIWYADLIRDYLSKKKAHIFGEKTPENTFFIPTLTTAFPNSKYIVLLRNPFDIVLSLCEGAILKLKTPITDQLLLQFAVYVKRGLHEIFIKKRLTKENHLYIRYEDLIVDPENTLKSICGFLNIFYEANMLDFQHRKKFITQQEVMNIIHAELNHPLNHSRINRSSTLLSPVQLYLLHQYLAPEIKHLPYQFTQPSSSLPLAKKILLYKAKIAFFLRLYLAEEVKNKLRFQLHYYAIRWLRKTPFENYFLKNLIHQSESWNKIIQSTDNKTGF